MKKKHRTGFVAILGRPNAGKSTLLNAFMGEKLAIIASKPQTTRTTIQGVVNIPGAQMVFIDTPGIHKSNTLLNKRMMNSVRSAAESPDVVLYLIDALTPLREEDVQALGVAKKAGVPVIAVFNKIDWLKEKPKLFALIEQYQKLYDFVAYVPISARYGDGIDKLQEEIVKHLPSGPPFYPEDHTTDQPERFLTAEVIREKILHQTEQEVPHAAAVVIESWEEEQESEQAARKTAVSKEAAKRAKATATAGAARAATSAAASGTAAGGIAGTAEAGKPESGKEAVKALAKPGKRPTNPTPLTRISATIYVEKPGQKAILIGAGGATLKKIGTHARVELERLLDRRIYLQLLVKVKPNWREDPGFLSEIDWRH